MGTNGQLGNGTEDDVLVPGAVGGKQLEKRRVISASAGGQHTILLAMDKVVEPLESNTSKPNWLQGFDYEELPIQPLGQTTIFGPISSFLLF